MRTYDPIKRHGGSGRAFTTGSVGNGNVSADAIDLLCGAGMAREWWFKHTEKYLKSLQNEDGSFKLAHSTSQHTVMTTCYAVLSLKAIGCEDAKVFEKAKEYILSLRNEEDGSFGWSDVDRTGYSTNGLYAITALRAVGYDGERVFRQCCEYMESLENLDGGFGSRTEGSSDIEKTSMVLLALKAAGTPKSDMPVSKTYVMMSLKDGKGDGDGGFGNAVRTSHAILALRALGYEVPEDSKEYLVRKFNGRNNDDTINNNVSQLYHTAIGLFAAGERDLPAEYADYVRKLKNTDGGFGGSAASGSECESNVESTFHAIMALKAVKKSRQGWRVEHK